jgi:hypothetical protein
MKIVGGIFFPDFCVTLVKEKKFHEKIPKINEVRGFVQIARSLLYTHAFASWFLNFVTLGEEAHDRV